MPEWWYERDGQRVGPIEELELRRLLQLGRVGPKTLAWRSGLEGWCPLGRIPELQGPSPVTPSSLPGRSEPENQPRPISADPIKGARWRRLWARVFDQFWEGLLLVAALMGTLWFLMTSSPAFFAWWDQIGAGYLTIYTSGIFNFLSGAVMQFLILLIEAVLYTVFGNTPGKALLGLRVVDGQGKRLGFGAYLMRLLLLWVQGFGLHIPILNLAAPIYQFVRLGKGQPASYDRSKGRQVLIKSPSRLGVAVVVIVLLSLNIAIVYFGFKHAERMDRMAQGSPAHEAETPGATYLWENRITGISTRIDSRWFQEDLGQKGDVNSIYFFAEERKLGAVLRSIYAPDETLEGFVDSLREMYSSRNSSIEKSRFDNKYGRRVWIGVGRTTIGGHKQVIRMEALKLGDIFWNIEIITNNLDELSDPFVKDLHSSILKSIGLSDN